ncbi:hypothetical protein [Ralstonia syzygii]|uniref:hypothetical protein n=1 Tax=Ralstonia syzygii TaxID=28097 RepID=UPI0036F3AB2F
MIMKKRTSLVVALISFSGAAFFLAWAIQTAWIASFPGCSCPQLAYWFYSQFFGFVVLAIIGGGTALENEREIKKCFGC